MTYECLKSQFNVHYRENNQRVYCIGHFQATKEHFEELGNLTCISTEGFNQGLNLVPVG